MNKKVISDFQRMIDVNTPIIYINDYDFVRIDEIIVEIVGNSKVFEWNPATGTTNFKTKESQGLGENDTLEQFLRDKYTVDVNLKEKFLVLKDIQDFIEKKLKDLEYIDVFESFSNYLALKTEMAIVIPSAISRKEMLLLKFNAYIQY